LVEQAEDPDHQGEGPVSREKPGIGLGIGISHRDEGVGCGGTELAAGTPAQSAGMRDGGTAGFELLTMIDGKEHTFSSTPCLNDQKHAGLRRGE
jgi:hypothetical protein